MAMAWAIAALAIDEPCEIQGRETVRISFPTFWEELAALVV
jgi:5-enolpyruvylshikimate-3-phosphate synthase